MAFSSKRVTIPGLPHYIAQRAKCPPILGESGDCRVFLHLLEESCERHQVAIWGYALLAGGYSLVVVPRAADSLNLAIERLDSEYARYYNLRHMVRGQVWDADFQSAAMCWSQVWDAIAFVEREPVRRAGVAAAWAHPWSSAAARLEKAARTPWLHLGDWQKQFTTAQWQRQLQVASHEAEFGQEIAFAIDHGTALGATLATPAPLVRKGPRRAGELRVPKQSVQTATGS